VAGESPWEGHRVGTQDYRRILRGLACAGVATFAQLYAPQAVLPDICADLDITPDQAALLISTTTMGLAAGVLAWSWLADRVGRLPAMRWSLTTATALGFGVVICPSFPGMLALRILEGMAIGGLAALALTYLQEEVHPAHTPIAAGAYIAATSVGGLSGRIVAAVVASWCDGWRWGVGASALLAAAGTAGLWLSAPRPRGFTPAAPGHGRAVLRLVVTHLRSAPMVATFAQGFALQGGFVTIFNYLAFRLREAPFGLSTAVTSMLFLAYATGVWSSRRAGRIASRRGRLPVLLGSTAVMMSGALLTMVPSLPVVIAGLLLLATGFFGAHSTASGWTAAQAHVGRAQATSLYNLFYYVGASVLGWVGGIVFVQAGWSATVGMVAGVGLLAAGVAAAFLRSGDGGRGADDGGGLGAGDGGAGGAHDGDGGRGAVSGG
jgi:predicted MFS family arabinose efflux permease